MKDPFPNPAQSSGARGGIVPRGLRSPVAGVCVLSSSQCLAPVPGFQGIYHSNFDLVSGNL